MDAKSIQRIKDIGKKAGGDPAKMNSLARTQANLITDGYKAFSRFECAVFFYGPFSQVALRFLDRAVELNHYDAANIKKNISTLVNYENAYKEVNKLISSISTRGNDLDPRYERIAFVDA